MQLTRTGRVENANGVATDGMRVYFTERNGGRWSLAQVSAARAYHCKGPALMRRALAGE